MDERPRVVIDWSESGWTGFAALFWVGYLVIYVPLRFIWDITFGRRR
jgi:hypothetical protein